MQERLRKSFRKTMMLCFTFDIFVYSHNHCNGRFLLYININFGIGLVIVLAKCPYWSFYGLLLQNNTFLLYGLNLKNTKLISMRSEERSVLILWQKFSCVLFKSQEMAMGNNLNISELNFIQHGSPIWILRDI